MAEPGNLKAPRDGVLELAARGLRAQNDGRRLPKVKLDVDSLPLEVHGHQPKAEWTGHYNARIYYPLVTYIAETGDILNARMRPGNAGTAESARDVILDMALHNRLRVSAPESDYSPIVTARGSVRV